MKECSFNWWEEFNYCPDVYEIIEQLPYLEIEELTVKYNWENDNGFKD